MTALCHTPVARRTFEFDPLYERRRLTAELRWWLHGVGVGYRSSLLTWHGHPIAIIRDPLRFGGRPGVLLWPCFALDGLGAIDDVRLAAADEGDLAAMVLVVGPVGRAAVGLLTAVADESNVGLRFADHGAWESYLSRAV